MRDENMLDGGGVQVFYNRGVRPWRSCLRSPPRLLYWPR